MNATEQFAVNLRFFEAVKEQRERCRQALEAAQVAYRGARDAEAEALRYLVDRTPDAAGHHVAVLIPWAVLQKREGGWALAAGVPIAGVWPEMADAARIAGAAIAVEVNGHVIVAYPGETADEVHAHYSEAVRNRHLRSPA